MNGPGGYTSQSIRDAWRKRTQDGLAWGDVAGNADNTEAVERIIAIAVRFALNPSKLAHSAIANASLTQNDGTVLAMTVAYACVLGMLVEGHALDTQISDKLGYPVGGANAKIFEKFPQLRTPQYKTELENIVNDQNLPEKLRTTAQQLLNNEKTDTGKRAFFGVQELVLSKMPAVGALSPQPGALSSVSPVRNPTSYNEAVRTAGEAANIARSSAPTPELGQFATSIAGISKPSDKAKALQERLATATDQAEIDYLNKFVEPLTKFGKKGK